MKPIRILIILLTFLLLISSTPGQSATLVETYSPDWSPLVITSPTSLTPMPDAQDPLCKTYWYIIDNAGGYPAYLTLNVAEESGSTNSGEWRPYIPTTGFYQIEVYLPAHDTIDWNCGATNPVNLDSTNAQYTISTPSGIKNVVVNQAANTGVWVSLGNYFLTKGIDNILSLSDITGEPDFKYLVSFSMARFTWLPGQSRVYIPTIYKDFNQATLTKVTLDSATPYAREGVTRLRFDMDEPVTYRITGTNGYPAPETNRLTWQYVGPCGFGPESETLVTLPVGSWSYDLSANIDACPGQNTAIIRIYSRNAMLYKSINITVDGGGTLQLFESHAFDSCGLPSLDDFKVWWNQSPYEVYNIYLGGISLFDGCKSTRLNRDFIRDAQNIGWGFISTWVGPQAPCFGYKYPFDWDVGVAYNEGMHEAQMAFTKAKILGLVEAANSNTILYYDLEHFRTAENTNNFDHPCRQAARSFIRGWVQQLHDYGVLAGVYGGSYGSFMSDYWSISPVPDAIWAAEWYKIDNVYQFDPQASVYSLSYLRDEYWNPYRRIHQYAGDHDEAWGGRQMNIDSDVSDTRLYLPRIPTQKPAVQYDLALVGTTHVVDFQLLSPEQGWLVDQGIIYWTDDGGASWRMLDIPLPDSVGRLKVFFLNSSKGWLVVSSQDVVVLLSTDDGGASWQSITLPDKGPVDPLEITFLDSLNGTIKFRFQTSQAFREGYLITTNDGGLTWQTGTLSQDDPAWEHGQAGKTVKSAAGEFSAPDGALQVKWLSSSQGWASVFKGACSGGGDQAGYICRSATVLVSTMNSGQTWQEIYP